MGNKRKTAVKKNKLNLTELKKDLDLDRRAFLKKYAKKLKGPGKMAIFIFYLSKGQKRSVNSSELEIQWNKTKGILGEYNSAYLVRSREYEFVKEDPVKKKHYQLTNSWPEKLIHKYFK